VNKRYIVGAIVAAVVVVGVLVGISLAGGDDDGGGGGELTGAAEVTQQFEGLPQSGNVVGDPDAPVEIIEYGDLACPACKLAAESTVPEAIDALVRDGQAKLVFRPIAFIHPLTSERGALGAEAAAMQDAMWPFVDLIYRNQGNEQDDWLSEDMMMDAVEALGLDADKWKSDYDGSAVADAFVATEAQAQADQVDVTPTFVVRGPGGETTVTGAVELSELEDAVAEVSAQS
jgi:protein-disulfide isomerase